MAVKYRWMTRWKIVHISWLPLIEWANDFKKVWFHKTQGAGGKLIVNEVDCSARGKFGAARVVKASPELSKPLHNPCLAL